jgi:glucokinase
MSAKLFPRLIADIGGTNARFSIEVKPYTYESTIVMECNKYKTLASAVIEYLTSVNMIGKVHHAALALPAPEVDDTLFMVNSPWHGQSISKTKKETGLDSILFLNDFHALALAIPHIDPKNLIRIGGTDEPDPKKPKAIIGPGTGLGMATLIKHPTEGYFSIPAEGGRSSFPPVNQEEVELWEFLHKRFNHVSVERFLSGPGLQLIYEATCEFKGIHIKIVPQPSEITELGLKGDLVCKRTLEIFCRILGTVASNLAVMVNAFGGVYIGGGVVPRILDFFIASDFRARFEDKGRYRQYLNKMPVFVITDQFPAFLGASYALDVYLNKGYIP